MTLSMGSIGDAARNSTPKWLQTAEVGLANIPSDPQDIPSGESTDGSTKGSLELVPLVRSLDLPRRMDPKLPCFSIGAHERNHHFFGREDVFQEIDCSLLPVTSHSSIPETKSLRSFGLYGLGGIGKTQAALEWVFRRRNHFHAIFWLRSENSATLGEEFARIAQKLEIEAPGSASDLVVSREYVKSWLSKPLVHSDNAEAPDNEANWLLVFDNVVELSILDDYWPKTGHGSVLLTSRDPEAVTKSYFSTHGMQLEKFPNADTVELLRCLTRNTVDLDAGLSLQAIAEHLDGIPLAIEQMAAIIREARMSYREFLRYYEQTDKKLVHGQDMRNRDAMKGYAPSLATVWAIDRLQRPTASLMEVISMLDPELIPESLLQEHVGNIPVEGFPRDLLTYSMARKELVKSSLVKHWEDKDGGGLHVHRIVQDVTKASMTVRRAADAFVAAIDLVEKAWPVEALLNEHDWHTWSASAALYPHVARLKDYANAMPPADTASAHVNITFVKLLDNVGW